MKVTLARSIELLTELAELQNGLHLLSMKNNGTKQWKMYGNLFIIMKRGLKMSQIYTIYGTKILKQNNKQ